MGRKIPVLQMLERFWAKKLLNSIHEDGKEINKKEREIYIEPY